MRAEHINFGKVILYLLRMIDMCLCKCGKSNNCIHRRISCDILFKNIVFALFACCAASSAIESCSCCFLNSSFFCNSTSNAASAFFSSSFSSSFACLLQSAHFAYLHLYPHLRIILYFLPFRDHLFLPSHHSLEFLITS